MIINVRMSWHKKTKLLHDKYIQTMLTKLRCGKLSFAKVVLKCVRKYCIKNRAHKCANMILSEPKPFAKHQYIKSIKKVVSCDMKFMKELKTFLKISGGLVMRKQASTIVGKPFLCWQLKD